MSALDVRMPPAMLRLMAASYLEAGLLDEAERLLTPPGRVDGWAGLALRAGLARAEQGAYDRALRRFQAILQADPGHQPAREAALTVYRQLVAERVERQEWEAARDLLTQALALSPNDHQLRSSVAAVDEALPSALIQQGRHAEATVLWEQRQRSQPTSHRLAHELALAHGRVAADQERAGQRQAADAAWRRSIGNWGLVQASETFWSTWVPSRAAAYGMAVPQTDAEQLRVRELREGLEKIHRDFEAAYQEQSDAANVRRHRDLRLQLRLELRAADALRQTRELVGSASQARAVPVAAGPLMLEHLGLLDAARELADWARTRHRDREEPALLARLLTPLGLAELLLEDGQPERAIAEIDALLRDSPNNQPARSFKARALATIGRQLAASDKQQEAMARWAEALALDPQLEEAREPYAEAVAEQARAMIGRKENRAARRLLEEALKKVPGHRGLSRILSTPLNNLGVEALSEANNRAERRDLNGTATKLQEAYALLTEAKKLDPTDMTITRNLEQVNEGLAIVRRVRGY